MHFFYLYLIGLEEKLHSKLDILLNLQKIDIRLQELEDLRVPPGNRLEPLTGDREGQHSIRINNQYRICFVWSEAGPCEVEIVDYH